MTGLKGVIVKRGPRRAPASARWHVLGESGQTTLEYALIVAAISAVMVLALRDFGAGIVAMAADAMEAVL